MARADMTREEFAERIDYSRSAVVHFLRDAYHEIAESDILFRSAAWEYLQRHPVEVARENVGRLFVTQNYKRIRQYIFAAAERGQVCLLYGPPGTQKSFVIEYLVAERNREKKNDLISVYASIKMPPRALLHRIALATGGAIPQRSREQLLAGLIRYFRSRPSPGAIIVDEAQHLGIEALEILRELNDRGHCGLVLAGSHNLYENFLRGRQHLEQWLSRIDHKEPLPGLLEKEAEEIARRELGNGEPAEISKIRLDKIVAACRVDDIFARDKEGKPALRKYLSVRRLVKIIAQLKEAKEAA
jgi:DNA transposition AAA+ family ATPase